MSSEGRRPTTVPYICRAVTQSGQNGAAVNIPAEVRRDIGGLEPGADGDTVDMEFDREKKTLTIFLD